MKKEKHRALWLLIPAFAGLFAACGKGEDPLTPPTPQPEAVGEVSYSPSAIAGGTGSGTTSDPAVARCGDTLTVAIKQESRYRDSNGEVFSCQPKAVVKVFASADTLFAKDIKTLMNAVSHTGALSQSQAGDVKTMRRAQTLTIGGGAEIVLDLVYEIYSHLNSQHKTIEMPYTWLDTAKVNISGIRLSEPASQSRAGTIVDSTAYQVTVPVTVDYRSANTKDEQTKTLAFEVVLDAVVETATEIPDPMTQFSYELSHKSGTGSNASPFDVIPGDSLFLEWSGVSSYQYFSISNRTGMEIKYEPWAFAKVYAEKADTMWIKDVADLKAILLDPIVATSGTNPVENTAFYAWNIAGQKVSLDFGYLSYLPFTVEGEEVNLPYLMLRTPELYVAVDEVPNGVLKGKLYTVTITVNQDLTTVNVSEPKTEHLQYVVKYLAAIAEEEPQPITLTDIQYRKGLPQWDEAHNNIGLGYYYRLRRDSLFSDGTIHTVESHSGKAEPECKMFNGSNKGKYIQQVEDVRGVKVYYFAFKTDKNGETDHIWQQSRKIAVPDISLVTIEEVERKDQDPHDWSRYHGYDPANPQSGWYWTDFASRNFAYLCYNYANGGGCLAEFTNIFRWYNNICYVEDGINGGQLIDFLGDENDLDDISYAPEVEFSITEETITMPTGEPAKVFTHTCLAKFISWDEAFPAVLVDTVYQYDPAHPPF